MASQSPRTTYAWANRSMIFPRGLSFTSIGLRLSTVRPITAKPRGGSTYGRASWRRLAAAAGSFGRPTTCFRTTTPFRTWDGRQDGFCGIAITSQCIAAGRVIFWRRSLARFPRYQSCRTQTTRPNIPRRRIDRRQDLICRFLRTRSYFSCSALCGTTKGSTGQSRPSARLNCRTRGCISRAGRAAVSTSSRSCVTLAKIRGSPSSATSFPAMRLQSCMPPRMSRCIAIGTRLLPAAFRLPNPWE